VGLYTFNRTTISLARRLTACALERWLRSGWFSRPKTLAPFVFSGTVIPPRRSAIHLLHGTGVSGHLALFQYRADRQECESPGRGARCIFH